MDLKNLHLEETVVLPEELEAVIADGRELTLELKKKGFSSGGQNESKNPPGPYNFFDEMNAYSPFRISVAEVSFDKWYVFTPDEEVDETTIYYEVEFDCYDKHFVPYHKFINKWAAKNSTKGEKLNCYFGQWIDAQIDGTDYPDDVVGFRLSTPCNNNTVSFWLPGRENFMRLLKDFSAAFRKLAAEGYSEPSAEDEYNKANDFWVDPEATASTAYYDLTNHKLVPLIAAGIRAAIEKYKELAGKGEAKDENVSVELDTTMKFYFGEDECEGEPFFEFKLGPVHDVSMKLQKKMEKEHGAGRSQAVSNLFEDAVCGVDGSLLGEHNFVLWVPEVGGDPYIYKWSM